MKVTYIDGKRPIKVSHFDKPVFYEGRTKWNIIASEITGSAPDAVTHTVKSEKGIFRVTMTKLIKDFDSKILSDTKNINQ